MKLLIIGLYAEGNTDNRFLPSIVQKTLQNIAINDYDTDIEIIFEVIKLENLNKKDKQQKKFINKVLAASKQGVEKHAIHILCVHTDADDKSDKQAFETRIKPAQIALNEENGQYCKTLLPIVPIQMIEAWMLADTDLLKEELGTTESNQNLGLHRKPESIADPKKVINDAIAKVNQKRKKPKRRRKRKELTIGELYGIIGTKLHLDKLEPLSSYQTFKENVRKVFRELNFLH